MLGGLKKSRICDSIFLYKEFWMRCSNGRAADCNPVASASWFDSNLIHQILPVKHKWYMRPTHNRGKVGSNPMAGTRKFKNILRGCISTVF